LSCVLLPHIKSFVPVVLARVGVTEPIEEIVMAAKVANIACVLQGSARARDYQRSVKSEFPKVTLLVKVLRALKF
jgi:hypothetical protein